MPIRACLPAVLLLTACTAETFHARGDQALPPVADRAVLVAPGEAPALAGHATLIGTIDGAGNATQGQADLADKAAVLAANRGGTHLEVAQSGLGATATLWGPIGLPSLAPDAPSPFVEPPESPIGDLALPLWTELTIKTGCSWGVQGLASYDVRPFDMAASAPSFAVGMIWQPATACQ